MSSLWELAAKGHAEFPQLRSLSTAFMRVEMLNAILSVAMLSAFLLLYGAGKRWRRDGASQQMWLMVAAAFVIFANVAIWVVPDEKGQSLVTGATEAP
ncbi:MAG: hypothetical protein RLZZ61_790 [Pseudomonadota bacterium]|jgi:hypothetical protein